jgi:hypothetical protein
MNPEGLYTYQFDPNGQEVDTRRHLETPYISIKYQCLQKHVGHILYEKLHFPKNRQTLFFYFLFQCILYYAKLNFKLGISYDIFLSDTPCKTKTVF